ncbi:hypothetical protein AB0H83_44585 [Dactylosporangium sp. NPDC050688]|uniref:hypothetical protein n=1 Tax=Dactylosporangium sp. NPDC050688 TaxID=3157217 RepID=UPI0033C340F1
MTATTHQLTGAIPASFPAPLRDDGILLPASTGLYGWDHRLEQVFDGLAGALTGTGRRSATRVLRFPPLLSRPVFERCEFADSFPHLVGSVHAFHGGRREHQQLKSAVSSGADWGDLMALSQYVLTPAACYPVYPFYTGTLPAGGVEVDVLGHCFRHEPSDEAGRLVSFRQREFVRLGTPEEVADWVTGWHSRALAFVRQLGLDAHAEVASDPFFGASGGKLLAASQQEQQLKMEIIAPIGDGHPVAVASCNSHRDHFGRVFGIHTADGGIAHAACVGFGQERLAFALVAAHGADLDAWPDHVRRALWNTPDAPQPTADR